MAVKIPGAGITAEMAGRSRYGQWVGRVWLCRDLEKGSLQELMGGRDMARVVAGNGLYRYLEKVSLRHYMNGRELQICQEGWQKRRQRMAVHCVGTWSRDHCRNGWEVGQWGGRRVAVQIPEEWITARMAGRSRYGKSGGRGEGRV